MSKRIAKTAAFALALGICAAGMPAVNIPAAVINVSAAEKSTEIIDSGELDGIKWTLDSSGTFTVSGKGKLPEFKFYCENTGYYKNITTVIIKEGITETSIFNFSDMPNLTRVELPDSLEKIGSRTFDNCKKLKEIVLPEGITDIDFWAFFGCESLEEINIPASAENFNDAFSHCTSLKAYNVSKNNAKYSSYNGVVYSKDGKTLMFAPIGIEGTYTIADGTEKIAEYSFEDCKKLKKVNLPESMRNICSDAFINCEKLTSVNIPANVRYIGKYKDRDGKERISNPFYGCKSLKKIAVSKNNKYFRTKDGILYTKDMKKLIAAPSAVGMNVLEVPKETEEICDQACSFNSFEEVKLPAGLTRIGWNAFCENDLLKKITLPNGITELEYGTFSDCKSLKKAELPDSIVTIGEYCFDGCTSLTEVKLPKDLREIGNFAFSDCGKLKNIEFPEKLEYIRIMAFWDCVSLKSIVIPQGVIQIDDSAFGACDDLEEVTFQGRPRVDRDAFADCPKLKTSSFDVEWFTD